MMKRVIEYFEVLNFIRGILSGWRLIIGLYSSPYKKNVGISLCERSVGTTGIPLPHITPASSDTYIVVFRTVYESVGPLRD